jgi:hypothetical protein
MYVAKNNIARVENNYLKDNQFLYIMSPDEIFGISANIAGEVWPILVNLQLRLGQYKEDFRFQGNI